ncbi:MAG TPA: ATP-binding protein, partial [Bryobacteraceae bacterium]|nr:ATP-binding protein [Bryobacteraceae bacterium]
GNAVKFTEAGQVCLRIEPEGIISNRFQRLRFVVIDTGLGIALDKQALIFETFTQADGSISRQYGGTGLGLTISRQIVERMGGTLAVSSTPGQGSTFSFSVPFEVTAPREVPMESASSLANAPPAPGLNILLVEDSKDNQLLICAYLKGATRSLAIAANGEIAVEKFKAGFFDVVLMDVQMPVMDGYEATRTIRAWELSQGRARTPILALSAHAMEEAFEKSLTAGCDVHLTKPITKAVLLQAIAQYTNTAPPIEAVKPAEPGEFGKDLAPWYLDRRREDVVALAAALVETNYDAVRVMGHNMKGSGRGYGFNPISEIGASLEAAAVKRSDSLIETEISALGVYLKSKEARSG